MFDLTEQDLERVMRKLTRKKIDLADLFLQYRRFESWSLEDDQVKDGHFSLSQGAGLRAVQGEKSGFAYTEELSLESLLEAADKAGSISQQQASHPLSIQKQPVRALYSAQDPLNSLSDADKIALLQRMNERAKAADPRIKKVDIQLVAAYEQVWIMDEQGHFSQDQRPLVRCSIHVLAEQNGRWEKGSAGAGNRVGLDYFIQISDQLVDEAVRQALLNLEAVPTPAGAMTVVLGSGWPGILLHEAVGHGLEGDFNRKGLSAFANRIGEQVASPLCTVVDDGTLEQRRGSLSIDDEGCPTQKTVLIENGRLKAYMLDRLNARLMGLPSTGNGRRESYAYLPMPRMTNTYMLPGEYERDEIIASVKQGLYAVNFSGGQVDITSGQFVFSLSEAYLIENGKITAPVKDATLIGNGPDVMQKISMVGNDFALDPGIGTCGKEGQSVPVGVGQPTLKVDQILVGGTAL